MIRRGDGLTAMRSDLQLGVGNLTQNHMRARARKFTGNIAMSDLWGKVTAIGEEWSSTVWSNGNRGNIINEYNPGYLAPGDWDKEVKLGPNGARDGVSMYAIRFADTPVDVGYGFGTCNIYPAEPGSYRLKLQITQDGVPGPLRFGVVEIIGSTGVYLGGNIQYLYRESTRLGNPLTVDTTINVSSSYPYISTQFTSIVKGSGSSFTPTRCNVDYMEITKI